MSDYDWSVVQFLNEQGELLWPPAMGDAERHLRVGEVVRVPQAGGQWADMLITAVYVRANILLASDGPPDDPRLFAPPQVFVVVRLDEA